MQKLTILYVTALPLTSNSSASIGNNSLIKGLIELGHTIEIATSDYPQDGIGFDSSINENTNLKTFSFDIGFYRHFYTKNAETTISNNQTGPIKSFINIIKKEILLDPFVQWARNARLFPKGRHYDIIISGSDPVSSHVFTSNLIKRNRVHCNLWIQIWGDPLYNDINRRDSHFKAYFKRLEAKLLQSADHVFYVSENTLLSQQLIYAKYASKMYYAPRAWLHRIKSNPTVTTSFGYFGDFLPAVRNIEPLLDAFSLPALSKLPLVIAGKGETKQTSPNITILGRLPYEHTLAHEREVSALIVICNLHGGQLPGKIYHYSGTDKPIIIILDGDSDSIRDKLSIYNRYIFCSNHAQDIAQAVQSILCGKYSVDFQPVEAFSPISIAGLILEKASLSSEV